jgi:hypothetical protein
LSFDREKKSQGFDGRCSVKVELAVLVAQAAQAAHLSANLFGCVRSEKPPPVFGGGFVF